MSTTAGGADPSMSTSARANQIAIRAAEQRVLERLKHGVDPPSSGRRVAVLVASGALFAITFAARLAIQDPDALIANFYVVPVALLAIEFGARAGVLAAAFGLALVFAWGAIQAIHVGVLGYAARGAALLVTGAVVGWFSDRLRRDIAERQLAQRSLALYADQLEAANQDLARSVGRLGAFEEIARAVGGETELQRVLSLILAHGREIVAARSIIICLPDGDELVAVTGAQLQDGRSTRMPLHGSLAGEVLTSRRPKRVSEADHAGQLHQLMPSAHAAILVPLRFRGETVGVLAGIDRADGRAFDEEDEQLLLSIAASAATALVTARSVAAERLRVSLQAAEEARARWARELHDQTLQGLTGARMVLSAGLARNDLVSLRRASESADAHLAAEMRSLRDLITELRPAALDDLGLGAAIESLARRQGAAGGFTVDVNIELEADGRPGEIEGATYRILQEALSNIVRHAGAEHVALRVLQLPRRLELTVEDDGHGFAPSAVSEGFGLTGMRERALLLGGELSVISRAGGPTRVSAVLPLRTDLAVPSA